MGFEGLTLLLLLKQSIALHCCHDNTRTCGAALWITEKHFWFCFGRLRFHQISFPYLNHYRALLMVGTWRTGLLNFFFLPLKWQFQHSFTMFTKQLITTKRRGFHPASHHFLCASMDMYPAIQQTSSAWAAKKKTLLCIRLAHHFSAATSKFSAG